MIKKERLEELVEQGATVYRTYADVSVQEVKLNKNYMKVDNAFLWQKMTGAFKGCGTPLEQLFETKEEAEWYREFGCIERTERLELPTWEEFDQSEKLIRFIGKFGQKCKIDGYFNLDLQSGFIDVTENGSSQINLPEYTKENYILACRKAKELFLGGSNGDIR